MVRKGAAKVAVEKAAAARAVGVDVEEAADWVLEVDSAKLRRVAVAVERGEFGVVTTVEAMVAESARGLEVGWEGVGAEAVGSVRQVAVEVAAGRME